MMSRWSLHLYPNGQQARSAETTTTLSPSNAIRADSEAFLSLFLYWTPKQAIFSKQLGQVMLTLTRNSRTMMDLVQPCMRVSMF